MIALLVMVRMMHLQAKSAEHRLGIYFHALLSSFILFPTSSMALSKLPRSSFPLASVPALPLPAFSPDPKLVVRGEVGSVLVRVSMILNVAPAFSLDEADPLLSLCPLACPLVVEPWFSSELMRLFKSRTESGSLVSSPSDAPAESPAP